MKMKRILKNKESSKEDSNKSADVDTSYLSST